MENKSLYVLKAICAFLVVCIHCSYPSWDSAINPFARIAVPLFLMISGYFVYNPLAGGFKADKLKNVIHKIFMVALLPLLIYLSLGIYWKKIPVEWETFSSFAIYGSLPFFHQSWYLLSYFYMLVVLLLFTHYKCGKYLFALIIPLILVNLLLGAYVWLWDFSNWSGFYTRNFLFMSLPFFLLGAWMRKNEYAIKMRNYKLWILLFISVLCLNVEAVGLKLSGLREEGVGDIYIFLIPVLVIIFTLAERRVFDSFPAFLVEIGRTHSVNIYLFHILILEFVTRLLGNDSSVRPLFINPVMIYILSLMFSYMYLPVKTKLFQIIKI